MDYLKCVAEKRCKTGDVIKKGKLFTSLEDISTIDHLFRNVSLKSHGSSAAFKVALKRRFPSTVLFLPPSLPG